MTLATIDYTFADDVTLAKTFAESSPRIYARQSTRAAPR